MIICMPSPSRPLSVTEAARNFADVVNRAFYRHETTVLLKGGVAVAHISPLAPRGIPAAELAHRWSLLPHLSAAEAAVWDAERANDRKRFPLPASRWE